jgi:uncharacterized membrane protein
VTVAAAAVVVGAVRFGVPGAAAGSIGGPGHLNLGLSGTTNACSHSPTIPVATEAMMTLPYESSRPVISDNMFAAAVYVLYGLSYLTGFSVLVGVVIAYVKIEDAPPLAWSHYRFQIRTFWIGMLYLAIGIPLCMLLIGIPILIWWFVWSLVRTVKGLLLVSEGKPIANPGSWLFG